LGKLLHLEASLSLSIEWKSTYLLGLLEKLND